MEYILTSNIPNNKRHLRNVIMTVDRIELPTNKTNVLDRLPKDLIARNFIIHNVYVDETYLVSFIGKNGSIIDQWKNCRVSSLVMNGLLAHQQVRNKFVFHDVM